MSKKKQASNENFVAVEETLSKAELFVEKNQKLISIIIGIIILIVVAYFAYNKYYLIPKNNEAQSQMFMAEKYFEKDSVNLALNGDGNYIGFIEVISEYKRTKSANLAKYYAGLCYFKKGDFNKSIEYLKKYNSNDYLLASMAKGVIGDAYIELQNYNKALDNYLKAADFEDNSLTTPQFLFKAASTCELLKDYDKAVEVYKRIKEDYSSSPEAREIDKYIARADALR